MMITKYKLVAVLISTCTFMNSLAVNAQTSSFEGICFEQRTNQKLKVAESIDLESLTVFDKQKFVSKMEYQQHKLSINENGFFSSEMLLIDHENAFPNWYTPPYKIKYDEDGIYSYFEPKSDVLPGGWVGATTSNTESGEYRTEGGDSYLFMEHSDVSLSSYEIENAQTNEDGFLKQFLFQVPSEVQISEFEAEGFVLNRLDDKMIFTKDSDYVEWDLRNYTVHSISMENEKVTISQLRQYSYNPQFDNYLISEDLIELPQLFDNGDCFSEMIQTIYSNFSTTCQIEDNQVRNETSIEDVQFSLFPNPVSSILTVDIPMKMKGGQLKIYSASRQLIQMMKIDDRSIIELDMNELIPGMYILSLEKNDITLSSNFLKH